MTRTTKRRLFGFCLVPVMAVLEFGRVFFKVAQLKRVSGWFDRKAEALIVWYFGNK